MSTNENICYNNDAGKLIIETELIKKNIDVCKSIISNKTYDFIIVNSKFKTYKIQIITSNAFNGKKVQFNLKTPRLIDGKVVYKTNQDDVINFLFCFNNKTGDIFLLTLPEFKNKTSITFRYDKELTSKNCYKKYLLQNRFDLLEI